MNTKIRISIWIVALFLVFSGIGLSSQKALAASGRTIQNAAFISVYRGYAMATVYAGLPYSVALLRQASLGLPPTSLSVAGFPSGFALLRQASLGLPPTNLSVNDIDESRLIDAYSLQAVGRFSAGVSYSVALLRQASLGLPPTSLSVNDIDESRLIEAYSLQAIGRYSAGLSFSVALLRQASRGIDLTTLSAADVSGYSRQLIARSSSAALSTNDIDESRLLDTYRSQAFERFYASYGGR